MKYKELVRKADSLYEAKNYKESAQTYSAAFETFNWKGYVNDRYNAACTWALAGNADSAFFNLERIVSKGLYTDSDHVATDEDLASLHGDPRWTPLITLVGVHKRKSEEGLNKELVRELDEIFNADQKYRVMNNEYMKKYPAESKELKDLWMTIRINDSLNLIKVKKILDEHGWLGPDSIGDRGNTTLFLVIQHSDLKTQEKYLPMMEDAVEHGQAQMSQLALLVDRIEMGNGRPQIYGSQVTNVNGKPVFYKIADEAHVNERRAEAGLEPIEEYAQHFGIVYKRVKH